MQHQYKDKFYNDFFWPIQILLSRAVEREVEPVIFAGARDSKGPKSKIDLTLGHILVFLGPEKCGISKNVGLCAEA